MDKRPRNSCKAIVIDNGALLTIAKRDGEELYHVLPGGGQRHGESFVAALRRECLEELGTEPEEIGDLLFIREYIGINHQFPRNHAGVHQVEYLFECRIDSSKVVGGTELDEGQEGTEWIPLEKLLESNFYPKALVPHLLRRARGERTRVYLGDIN